MSQVHEISSGDLTIEIATNTKRLEEAYGPRFDRSAQVVQINAVGRQWLGGPGLPDEFGLWGHGVLGYDAAEAGEGRFLKLGVGVLRKLVDEPYQLGRRWPEVRGVTAVVHSTAGELRAEHEIAWNGWAYSLCKTYRVSSDDGLVVEYVLDNRGAREIAFEHYNHNFFARATAGQSGQRLAIQPSFAFPDPPAEGKWERGGEGIHLRAESVSRREPSWSWTPTQSHGPNEVKLTWPDGTAVTATGNFPLARFALWAKDEQVCPELFYRGSIASGQQARWAVKYQFSIV